ncbi:diacylglycerol/lipid kinase family protein [Sphingobacterium sp. LRF_L2]|uniref:diacylglycerol/lipid kinase family protein n=1 Tax=Sphingobacterium sp. LRF_L2 TaxID=3369421 RepID=UPI003F6139CF
MEQVILLHNPKAGDEDHLPSDLVEAIENEGFSCVYFAVKNTDRWKEQLDQADFAAVAGGDGTVRRVVKELTKRTALDKKIPITILPMGTANNLSRTLKIDADLNFVKHIQNWKKSKQQRFDVGLVKSVDTSDFFIESVGYGIFPILIQKMENVPTDHLETTKEELKVALEELYQLILTTPADKYRLEADGIVHEGNCLLLEVMNIQSIGPNLMLAPEANTDDGLFDIILVKEEQRKEFADYIKKRIRDDEAKFPFETFRTKELVIECNSKHMHLDDELVLPFTPPLTVEVREHVLDFLVQGS